MNPRPPTSAAGKGRPGRLATLAALAACVLLGGCGYSTRGLLREDIETVCVPVFDNKTFRRGLEVDLTQAVIEEIKLHTRLHIAARGDADSTLEGSLLEFDSVVETESIEREVIERSVKTTVSVRWVDNRTGREILRTREIEVDKKFAAPRSESPQAFAFRKVAERIVELMEEEW